MTSKSILIILSYSVSVHFSCIFVHFSRHSVYTCPHFWEKYFSNWVSSVSDNPRRLWQAVYKPLNCKSSLALYCSSPGISLAESFKRPNQQYQSTEGNATKDKSNNENNKIHICIDNNRHKKDIHKISRTSPLVYTNMGWLGDGSSRGQVRQA